MKEICAALGNEHAALDIVVCDLSEDQWGQSTPAQGWNVKDTIVHLIQADMAAHLAVTDADGFQRARTDMADGGFDGVFGGGDGKSGANVLAWWREERENMLNAFLTRGPKDRIPWFGPDMSTISFATARLMETWAHGQDVADALGAPWPATDRLRHVAHIGVATRHWSYLNRGREVPPGPVRVELSAPSGQVWTWGPQDAENRVTGSAIDFCLVVTQRRHRADSAVETHGELATEWIELAQAFAGPPTLPHAGRGPGPPR